MLQSAAPHSSCLAPPLLPLDGPIVQLKPIYYVYMVHGVLHSHMLIHVNMGRKISADKTKLASKLLRYS